MGFFTKPRRVKAPSPFRVAGTLPQAQVGAALGPKCNSVSPVVWSCLLRRERLPSVRDRPLPCPPPTPQYQDLPSSGTAPDADGTRAQVKTMLNKLTMYNPTLYQPCLKHHASNKILNLHRIAEGTGLQRGQG